MRDKEHVEVIFIDSYH